MKLLLISSCIALTIGCIVGAIRNKIGQKRIENEFIDYFNKNYLMNEIKNESQQ